MLNLPRLSGSAVALVLFSTFAVLPARADLSESATTKVGEYLLINTDAGRAITEAVLGAPLRGDNVDELLARLRAPENDALARDLDARLARINSEARADLGDDDLSGLGAEARAELDRLSARWLALRGSDGGRVEFVTETPRGYAATRERFLAPAEPAPEVHETAPEARAPKAPEARAPLAPARPALRPAPKAPEVALDAPALAERYGVKPDAVRFSPKNKWPGVVVGLTREAQMAPAIVGEAIPHPGGPVDTVVVGSGPAGLTSTMMLSDSGQKVLVLEASSKIGGLANGSTVGDARFGSGAAYYAAPSQSQYRIFQRLGLGAYTKVNTIANNIDSLLLDGKLYEEFWEDEALDELPRSFKLYKYALKKMDALGMIGDQPIENSGDMTLDHYTAKQIVDKMPEMVAGWKDAASKRVYQEFLNDPRVDPKEPMKAVYSYLDPYGRSALGATTDRVNAMAFFNFQIAELEPRYTGKLGTGELSERFQNFFKAKRAELVSLQPNSPVANIQQFPDHAEITYVKDGQSYVVNAKHVVFAAPMKIAPKLITDFATIAPEHAAALAKIPYTDYMVTNVVTDGQVTKGTYDYWFGNTDNKGLWVTDMINGRFQQFGTKTPDDGIGVMTLYQPKGEDGIHDFTPDQAFAKAEEGVEQAMKLAGPTLKMKWGTELKPKWIIANVYPSSIQVLAPGYFTDIAPVFRKPIGDRIFVAGIVTGTPSVEESIYSGQRAAEGILNAAK
jgi:protoporphyrinogen oxidase